MVFTEYRDTQTWLADLLRAEDLGGDGVALLHGGVHGEEREQLRLAFQADPTEHPVRILLATDAASEGIDLQNHCHRLVNYDIPFNPNKLEQRIGRIDRYGQRVDPGDPALRRHRFRQRRSTRSRRTWSSCPGWRRRSPGWRPTSARSTRSCPTRCSAACSASRSATPRSSRPAGRKQNVPVEANVGEQVRRLRADLDETVEELGITPTSVKRVVDTALVLARQQPLAPHTDDRHLVRRHVHGADADRLVAAGQRRADREAAPHGRAARASCRSPSTPRWPSGRDDVVLAHLNHPLVAMSTRLLRAAVSNQRHRPAPGDRGAVTTTPRWRTYWSVRTPGSCWSAPTGCGCTRRSCTRVAGRRRTAGSAGWRT